MKHPGCASLSSIFSLVRQVLSIFLILYIVCKTYGFDNQYHYHGEIIKFQQVIPGSQLMMIFNDNY